MIDPAPGDLPPADPVPLPDELETLRGLTFYLTEVGRLAERGLLTAEAHDTVVAEIGARREAIGRSGRARGEFEAARRSMGLAPAEALSRLDRARRDAPGWVDPWALAVELRERLGDEAGALALCEEAQARFAAFPVRPDDLRARAEARRAAAERTPENSLTQARAALNLGHDAEVIALCAARLAEQPDHLDSLVLAAFARQRLGQLDEALTLYRRLAALQPESPAWSKWVAEIERRLRSQPGTAKARVTAREVPAPLAPAAVSAPAPAPPTPTEPPVSWSRVAGEFLQDHWQKLILCLAVLLIVVSSNVGAYQVLGPRLWSPVGKCVLALVYTAMFAGFGAGLTRWGAERAGRIMLLTTLIMVPANFLLAGEMRLLTEPSPTRLAVLGLDAAALLVLTRVVAAALGLKRGAGVLTAILFALSVGDAAASPGLVWPWGWHFAFFLAPAFVFPAGVAWVVTRFRAESVEGRREVADGALALFAFAFVTGLIRAGVFTLHLPPTLYALPTMLGAVTCVFVAARRHEYDPEPTHAAWLRFAGLTLSGLALSLALARPPGPAPVFSGNTLAVAALALALYAALLRARRQPAYLYFGSGALLLTALAAYQFATEFAPTADLVRTLELAAGRRLGYPGRPPLPFKAAGGLAFNAALALLAIHFRRAWGDTRLARHCHYIGIPLSGAASAFAALEPKAGLIVMAGYALLYGLAVRTFRDPRLVYGAAAATAGAALSGSNLVPGMTLAHQAFGLAALALVYDGLAAGARRLGFDPAFARTGERSALALAGLASVVALASPIPAGPVSLFAAGALGMAALVAALANRDARRERVAYAVTVAASLGYAFAVANLVGRGSVTAAWPRYALAAGAAALALAALGDSVRQALARGLELPRLAPYRNPLLHTSLVQVGLALLACGTAAGRDGAILSAADCATLAGAFALCSGALVVLTRPFPTAEAAYLAMGCGLGAWVAAYSAGRGGLSAEFADYGAAVASYALALVALEEWAARLTRRGKAADPESGSASAWLPTVELFAAALPRFEVGAVLGASALAVAGLRNGPPVVATFGAGATALFWANRFRRSAWVVSLALALTVATALSWTAWGVGWADPGVTFGWLAAVTAGLAVAAWCLGRWTLPRVQGATYTGPCFGAVALLSAAVFPMALGARTGSIRAFAPAEIALLTNALALLLLTSVRKRPGSTYWGLVSVTLAAYVAVFSLGTPQPDSGYVLGLVAVVLALGFSGVGFACRHWLGDLAEWTYTDPLFRSALVLTVLGVSPAYQAPGTMALVALSFLLFVKGLPARAWLYPALAALTCSVYFRFLSEMPPDRMVAAGLAGAYSLWLAAWLVRRFEPDLRRWLRLPGSGYDRPVFDSAVALTVLAVTLRARETALGLAHWHDSARLALGLAGFALFMEKAYPRAAWFHLAVALGSVAAVMGADPFVTNPVSWLVVGMALANGWSLLSRGLTPVDARLRTWLGLPDLGYPGALAFWSRGFFATAAVALGGWVAWYGSVSVAGLGPAAADGRAWWPVGLALALGAAYLPASWWPGRRASVCAGAWVFGLAALWWVGAPQSLVLARFGWDGHDYLTLATAAAALATVVAGLRGTRAEGDPRVFGWPDRGPGDPGLGARLAPLALRGGLLLAVLAAGLTLGWERPSTLGTLVLATVALGLEALTLRWVSAAYVAGDALTAAVLTAALLTLNGHGRTPEPDRTVFLGLAWLVAAGTLWAAAGLTRRSWLGMPEGSEGGGRVPARSVGLAFEQVAVVASAFAGLAVLTSSLGASPSPRAAYSAVGVLFGLALFYVGLIARWGAAGLVYPSQAALVGSYLYYRWAFPIPAATDAIVLTLFGYLDLGLAEVMARSGLNRLARATGHVALALPLLPLVLAGRDGTLSGLDLFVVFSAATFYAVTALRLRQRWLGYASAVLYNAFLWFLWGRFGWELTDHPQFFLIPVGLSAILFAEANVKELGRPGVNAIRGVGLVVIYLSLAAPIWQTQSFGAWLTLLALSLAGTFVGIALRAQTFLWLGLVSFVLDVGYQLARVSLDHALARWGIMLALGVGLVLFVALNEKKKIVLTLRDYIDRARAWD